MQEPHLLADIGRSILIAGIIGLPFYLMGLPLILAYILAGVFLGPNMGLAVVDSPNSIANISEIGLVLLLFILGLEINLQKLVAAGRAVIVGGIWQIGVCLFIGWFYFGWLLPSSSALSVLYFCIAGVLSSTLIVVKVLTDKFDLDSLTSRVSLGILIIQDIFAVAFLSIQPSLLDIRISSSLISISKIAFLFAVAWLVAKFVLPWIFKLVERQPELMLILAMSWCFAMCGFADYLGLSLEVGSLIAGIVIATFPYQLDVAAKVASLRDFFITLFFVSLGLQLPPLNQVIFWQALALILFVLVSRFLTVYPVLHGIGMGNRASLLPAVNLSQVSEFTLVLGSIGVKYGHIEGQTQASFNYSLIVSAIISIIMISNSNTIYKKINPFLIRLGFQDHLSQVAQHEELNGYRGAPQIVLLGFHREASSLMYEWQSKYSQDFLKGVLVVDLNPEIHKKLRELKVACHYGDISNIDTLRHLNLFRAKFIVSSVGDRELKGTTNLKLLQMLKQLAPESHLIMTAESLAVAKSLYAEGAAFVIVPRLSATPNLLDVIERMNLDGARLIRETEMEMLRSRNELVL